MKLASLFSLSAFFLTVLVGDARAEVVRYPIPNSTFAIAQAVKVPGDATTYYISGQVPPVIDKSAEPNSPQAYGDTKSQAAGALTKNQAIPQGLGLAIG